MTAKLVAALVLIGLELYSLQFMRTDTVIPERTEFAEFPRDVDDWHCIEPEPLPDDVLEKLKVTDYLSCVFVENRGESQTAEALGVPRAERTFAHLYVGYHLQQSRSASGGVSSIHPPEHCLPGSGWDIVDAKVLPIEIGRHEGEAKRFLIAKGNERNLVYFWYQSRGRVIARNSAKILYTFLDRMLRGRTDGALVRVTVPIENGDVVAADRTVARFIEALSPNLDPYLPN